MKWLKRIIIVFIIIVMMISGYFIYGGYQLYKEAKTKLSLEDMESHITSIEHYTLLEELPPIYLDAVVAVEDHRFYRHHGIDVYAIIRAVLNDIRAMSFVEGGSTITQQLAKNMYFTQDKVMERKVAEVFMAFDMERTFSKEKILELYINSIYFGDGYYNVYEASLGYFNKYPNELTEYEATLLAGIPNAPSAYSPTQSMELAGKRQRQVLMSMVDHNYMEISEANRILVEANLLPISLF